MGRVNEWAGGRMVLFVGEWLNEGVGRDEWVSGRMNAGWIDGEVDTEQKWPE